ncbi:hypothetical protein JRO89_XS13G0172800 [Xanthoceras sorbifolium]|uniref:Retrotransposon gag domain-containing protein n=1 Tax=Xanthoceras sorbifolium TaxID=99658 RepID=A0ABQ8H8T5_9ROSI|nr:hypothetical protein JRO89_XS13G0172800 [Xanthoceras sorbifolium]
MLEHSMGQMTWEQFKRALQTRFGSLEEANAGGTLSKLLQTGTVKEYQLQFERSSSTLPGPSQLALTSTAHTSSTPSLLGPIPPRLPLYRRLLAAEQAERRTKGLCFNCDEQFKPGHRCKTPQLLLLATDAAKDAELENESEDASPIVEISLKALTRLSLQNTMQQTNEEADPMAVIFQRLGTATVLSSSNCFDSNKLQFYE